MVNFTQYAWDQWTKALDSIAHRAHNEYGDCQ